MIDKLFTGLEKFTDILKPGRLVFYTGAGMFPVVVLFASGNMLGTPDLQDSLLTQFGKDLQAAGKSPWTIIYLSILAGFLINIVVFAMIVSPINKKVRKDPKLDEVDKKSFIYLFPMMRNDPETDYQAWLVSEYYRYVEICTLLPVSLLLSTLAFEGYCLLFIFRRAAGDGILGIDASYMVATLTMVVFGMLYIKVWPWWKQSIVHPILLTFQIAKYDLLRGLNDHEKSVRIL